jgi:hypothetical protein
MKRVEIKISRNDLIRISSRRYPGRLVNSIKLAQKRKDDPTILN